MREPLLSVENVWITFSTGTVPAVRGVTYSVDAGEVLAVVGESGAGKTVTALSLLGLLPRGATVTGRALLRDRDLLTLSPAELRSVRGNDIGMIFQEPMSALNPVLTIGSQLTEAIRTHQPISAATARRRAIELLNLVRLPDAARRLRSYPHELSGGQLQRIVIAMAIANDPALIIADEPTTALDVTVQAGILELLRDLRAQLDTAILLITHDMGVVADLADRVVVMHDGHVVEQGDVGRVFTEPQEDYTKQLLGAVVSLGHSATLGVERALHDNLHTDTETHIAAPDHPATSSIPDTCSAEPVLHLDNLSVTFGGRLRPITVHAVDTVSLHVDPGEILGLVGESGSGKTTIANAATGLLTPTHGAVRVSGTDLRRADRALRRHIGLVFQDPLSSLNPRATVAASIAEPIRLHRTLRGPAVGNRVNDLLEMVALPTDLRTRYPHELSGGQRQRVCIARALALNPDLLIADEPTSALDVSVQARILDLLRTLQREHGFACLFISHDLAVIEQLADRVAVMHRGHIVETGPTASVLSNPLHPYTQRLLAAAPVADPIEQARRRDAWRRLNVE